MHRNGDLLTALRHGESSLQLETELTRTPRTTPSDQFHRLSIELENSDISVAMAHLNLCAILSQLNRCVCGCFMSWVFCKEQLIHPECHFLPKLFIYNLLLVLS